MGNSLIIFENGIIYTTCFAGAVFTCGSQRSSRLKTWCKWSRFESNLIVGTLGWTHRNSLEALYVFLRLKNLSQFTSIVLDLAATLFTPETSNIFCELKHFTSIGTVLSRKFIFVWTIPLTVFIRAILHTRPMYGCMDSSNSWVWWGDLGKSFRDKKCKLWNFPHAQGLNQHIKLEPLNRQKGLSQKISLNKFSFIFCVPINYSTQRSSSILQESLNHCMT